MKIARITASLHLARRAMLAIASLPCVQLGWKARRVKQQAAAAAVSRVDEMGGLVIHGDDLDENDMQILAIGIGQTDQQQPGKLVKRG